jgi:hypothetical protein
MTRHLEDLLNDHPMFAGNTGHRRASDWYEIPISFAKQRSDLQYGWGDAPGLRLSASRGLGKIEGAPFFSHTTRSSLKSSAPTCDDAARGVGDNPLTCIDRLSWLRRNLPPAS